MDTVGVVGACLEHAERRGTPCARCGTFRCAECLSEGLCTGCRDAVGVRPIQAGDVYGFGRRFGGRFIDLLVGQGVGVLAGVVAAIVLMVLEQAGVVRAGWLERFDHGFGFNFVSGSASSVLGAAIGTWLCGATVGKAVLGMRVVRVDGQRAGLGANFVRELGYFVDALFFGLIAKSAMDASPLQQRHGDNWAGTVVVRSGVLRAPVAASTARLVLGIALGLAVQGLVLAGFFVVGAL